MKRYIYGGEVSYSWVIPKLSGIFEMCLDVNPEGMIEVLIEELESNKSL